MHSIAQEQTQSQLKQETHEYPPPSIWLRALRSPLWICLLIGIAVRLFLILHADPTLAGDEAMTGIQAENILHGLRPIYYYNQPYMGSLEAYILALFFAIAGPSVHVLRVATMSVSLIMIVLTWFLSSALADQAKLQGKAKKTFVLIATLIAALPPVYDAVLEMRSLGGYVEAMVIMLWTLLAALRLTQRWSARASFVELALRWLGIGFLIGLGLWVDPLTVYAFAAAALWIGGSIIFGLLRPLQRPHARRTLLVETLFALVAIPGSFIGFIPGIIYGLQNQWANITYMLRSGGGQQSSIHQKLQLFSIYSTCTAPRVIGGSLPTQPYVRLGHPSTLTPDLIICFICIALAVVAIGLSFFWQQPTIVRIRQLTLLPLLFMIITSIVFCYSSIVAKETPIAGCSQFDQSGRYAGPLVVALPFFVAAIVTLFWRFQAFRKSNYTSTQLNQSATVPGAPFIRQTNSLLSLPVKIILLLVLVVYFSSQFYYYVTSDPHTVFKNPNCINMLSDNTGIDQYLQQNNIHYALGTGWVADPVTFTTDGAVLASEPGPGARIAANQNKILQQDHYAFLFIVRSSNTYPEMLQLLDKYHYQYTVKRFPSQPGAEVMVVNPVKKIAPNDPLFESALHRIIYEEC